VFGDIELGKMKQCWCIPTAEENIDEEEVKSESESVSTEEE